VNFIVTASLRQVEKDGSSSPSVYQLVQSQICVLGRDLDCQIPVDPLAYTAVSRRHAEIRPVTTTSSNLETGSLWWVCDLNSSNGTFINGQRLVGCQVLRHGDRIVLGQQGPTYYFEQTQQAMTKGWSESIAPLNPEEIPEPPLQIHSSYRSEDVATRSGSTPSEESDRVTLTQLLPIFSTGLDIRRKAYILPAVVTIVSVVSLFFVVGNPAWFNGILAIYLGLAAYYRVYQLCGKKKAWWLLVLMGCTTIALIQSPIFVLFIKVFRQILPGQIVPGSVSLVNMFFGAGLMEELLKALPLFVIAFIGLGQSDRWRDRYGIREPLDGILLGTASAMGFTLLETLGQYVPGIVQTASALSSDAGQAQGLQILIARLLGSIAGHMAYSGYFGYAIGLAVLKPRRAALTIVVGYVIASLLHTMWNSVGGLPLIGPFALATIGLLSYILLGSAILQARLLSPGREKNFATRLGL
jgi:RsiW-degrading membrane proteinase PrsW (M82 family)